MSALLTDVPGELIPKDATPAGVVAWIKGKLTAQSWRVVAEDAGSVPASLYVVPPTTEAIGNAQTREVLRIDVANDSIGLRPVNEALAAYPQVLILKNNTLALGGGTNTNSVTIDGVTVTQSPAAQAGNTAHQNLRYLFEALTASANGTITGYVWQWQNPSPQNTTDDSSYIYGIRKTAAANQTVSVAGCLGGTGGNYHAAGLQSASEAPLAPASSITIDLASGFIAFLQINARGLAIASRCNDGYYGAVHAIWGDHQTALDSMPISTPGWENFVSPIELLVGVDGTEAQATSTAYAAKSWVLANKAVSTMAVNGAGSAHPFTRVMPRGVAIDVAEGGTYCNALALNMDGTTSDGSNLAAVKVWAIHRMQFQPRSYVRGGYDASPLMVSSVGAIRTEDWWRYMGAAPDENLQFGGLPTSTTTLVTALTRGGSESTIVLASTAGLPPSGAIVIEQEGISYAAKDTATGTITGCVRGFNGDEKVAHAAGCPVSQGLYWIKIHGGLIFCGPTLPD